MYKVVLLATLMFLCVNGIDYDTCPQMEPMSLFDMDKFSGVWYGVQSENNIPACEIFKITHSGEPFTYTMTTETRLNTTDHKYRTKYTETLTVPDLDFLSKMSVSPLPRVSEILSLRLTHMVESNFTVVNTDYETFALVYRCDGHVYYSINENKNLEDCSRHAFIWSRTPALSESFMRKIKKIIDNQPLESLLYNLSEIKGRTGCVPDSVQP
ncbi:uncharacterized protein LOC129565963 [Sitodiplosis mosellana]|uniref:uncharacterized protein LOC129565963 n=1 Tax=Sitodiplosis mosellana TaxID=263140 RepID=UPI002443BF08|nr:uncharacterized protein LOC129565963 [Sitodiplosis mosellana]XP_055297357.1 uncharacterized protein LOC129565963 [Sitodiplosis mosellana]